MDRRNKIVDLFLSILFYHVETVRKYKKKEEEGWVGGCMEGGKVLRIELKINVHDKFQRHYFFV